MFGRYWTTGATIVVTAALLGCASTACAQYGRGSGSNGSAVSFAYTGDENGWRLEFTADKLIFNAGWFNADFDSDIYALEVGIKASDEVSDYGGVPFAAGVGGYRFEAGVPEVEDETDFSFWAGAGDFTHDKKGVFYQYRYIFSGPLSGSQGLIGWAF